MIEFIELVGLGGCLGGLGASTDAGSGLEFSGAAEPQRKAPRRQATLNPQHPKPKP